MLGQMQYRILKAIKEGAVTELGIFFKVCKYIVEDDNILIKENAEELKRAANEYLSCQNTKGSKKIHDLYNTVNRSLHTLLRTSVVKRVIPGAAMLEHCKGNDVESIVVRETFIINPERTREVNLMMTARRVRNKELSGQ